MMRILAQPSVLLAIVLLPWAAASQTQQPASNTQSPAADAQAPPADAPTFRAGVDLVSVSVTVTDKRGRFVTDLTQDEFVIFEDKQLQPIANFRSLKEPDPIPIGLGLLVDASGSMNADKLASMRTAVDTLLKRGLDKADEVYLMEFANSSNMLVPWTTSRNEVLNAIRRLKTKPGTAIYDAIRDALPVSASGTAKKQVILVITDGADYNSTVNRSELAQLAWQSEVIIYALVVDREEGFGSRGSDPNLRQAALELNQITAPTGGQTFYVQGYQQLLDRITRLGDEFTQQYFLEYARKGETDGKLHEIIIGVKRPDVVIRHRRTYFAD